MPWVSGVDGCKGGWVRISRETESRELRFDRVEKAGDLLALAPLPRVVAIDIPIGLPDAGPRLCDRLARKRLGSPRRNSVFPAPIRAALAAASQEEASAITEVRDGRRVSAQGWALYPKIREVDELLQESADARQRIREIHPEICFWAWSGGRPMSNRKRDPAGRLERLALVEAWLGTGAFPHARECYPRRDAADDDILDAFAALWTATRIAEGRASTLPENPPADATGLPMEMVY